MNENEWKPEQGDEILDKKNWTILKARFLEKASWKTSECENIRQKELRRNFVFKKLSSEGKGKSEKDGRGLLKTLTALDESASHKGEQVWGNYNKNA